MLGMDRPPVATTSEAQWNSPWVVCTRKPSLPCSMRCTLQSVRICTPAAWHSSTSIFTICLDEISQNSCPSSFS